LLTVEWVEWFEAGGCTCAAHVQLSGQLCLSTLTRQCIVVVCAVIGVNVVHVDKMCMFIYVRPSRCAGLQWLISCRFDRAFRRYMGCSRGCIGSAVEHRVSFGLSNTIDNTSAPFAHVSACLQIGEHVATSF
jgi:hypothetical protein